MRAMIAVGLYLKYKAARVALGELDGFQCNNIGCNRFSLKLLNGLRKHG
jgi:hypothetical protein